MASGFEVYSDNGTLQASDKHYDLSRSRTQKYSGDIEFHDRVYAIEPDNTKGVNVKLLEGLTVMTQAVQGSGTLHIFEFGHAPNGNMGLEVYDEAGLLTFSSNLRSCNVIDFIDVPDYTNMGEVGGVFFTKQYDAARFAIIPIRIPFMALKSDTPNYNHLGTLSFMRNGNRLEIRRLVSQYDELSSFLGFVYPKRLSFAVIDVTNF